jgi:hypothetical protein
MTRPLRVFLCHASQDKPTVWKLRRFLTQHGIKPWLDREDLLPGEDWEVEIPRALFASDVILVCLSKNSVNKEGFVQKEITFALDKAMEKPEGTIFIIPIKLEECEIPKRLTRYQWVDLSRPDGRKRLLMGLNKRVNDLGDEVQQIILDDTRQKKPAFKRVDAVPANRDEIEKAGLEAKEKLEREAAAKAEFERSEQEAKEKTAREAVEKALREKTEREAVEKADLERLELEANEKLNRETAEKAEVEKMAQEAKEKSKREVAEKSAREQREKIVAKPVSVDEKKKAQVNVFISYSHRDNDYVHKLQKALQGEGFDVWIDDRIDYGTEWPKVIQKHLDECDAFIVVVSENAFESKWVQNEVARASRRKKPFFPLLLQGDPWLSVEATQYVDVTDGSLPNEK